MPGTEQGSQASEPPKEGGSQQEFNFFEINRRLKDPNLEPEMRSYLQAEREKIIQDIENFDDGRYLTDVGRVVSRILRTSSWDDVYDNLIKFAANEDQALAGLAGAQSRWRGAMETAIQGAAAKVALAGIEQKRRGIGELPADWFITHEYSQRRLEILERAAKEKDIFPQLLPDVPEQIVGKQIPKPFQFPEDKRLSQLLEVQQKLLEDFEKRGLALDELLRGSAQQTVLLTESLVGVEPREERKRWTDVEYTLQFYTRFTPNLEPKFYQRLSTEERNKFDTRWQLARAAFVKRATANLPEKYKENQDLEQFGKEKMEVLYESIPGVRQMLEAYSRAITLGEKIKIRDNGREKEMSFWEVEDADTFEKFRVSLRNKTLEDKIFLGSDEVRKAKTKEDREWWLDLLRKEADAGAWNWIWVGNLVESAESRYSWSGRAFFGIPSIMSAGEHKYVLHPQERFESKAFSGHFWGAFGKWGVTQVDRIKSEMSRNAGYNGDKDEIKFLPGDRSDYWSYGLSKGENPIDEKKKELGGRVFVIFAPECYPTASCKSFFEETTLEVKVSSGKYEKSFLLEYLTSGKRIPWAEVSQDAWGIYMWGKFNKAFQLLQYFNPEELLDINKKGWAIAWSNPLLELYRRLGLENELKKRKVGHQTFSKLKKWAFYASQGGVKDIDSKTPTLNLGRTDQYVVERSLKHPRVKYLIEDENLNL